MTDHKMREYYSARAPEYEQIYYRDVPQRRKEIDAHVARLQELVKGKVALDLACGTGYWTSVIAATAREVVASDASAEMLEEVRKKQFVVPTSFIEANMFEHQFERRFDLVSVGFWFSHQPRQEYGAFFDVIRRPLLDDGLIWLIDNNPPAEGPRNDSARVDKFGNNYKRRWLDNGTEFIIRKNYFQEEELRTIFSSSFKVVELTYETCYWSAILKPLL